MAATIHCSDLGSSPARFAVGISGTACACDRRCMLIVLPAACCKGIAAANEQLDGLRLVVMEQALALLVREREGVGGKPGWPWQGRRGTQLRARFFTAACCARLL